MLPSLLQMAKNTSQAQSADDQADQTLNLNKAKTSSKSRARQNASEKMIARYLAQELSPLDFERDYESLVARMEQLIKQGTSLFGELNQQPSPSPTTKPKLSIKSDQPSQSAITTDFRFVAESLAKQETNEDAYLQLASANLAGVFDGVASAGGTAQQATKILREQETDRPKTLELLLTQLNTKLKNQSLLQTTAAVAVVTRHGNERELSYGVVGDSRIGVWRKATGQYELAALDDRLLRVLLAPAEKRPSWVRELLTKASLDPNLVLPPQEAAKLAATLDQHPDPVSTGQLAKFLFDHRNVVTQALGQGNVRPHVGSLPVQASDRVLLATDGLHDNLTEAEIVTVLGRTEFEETASALVIRAHEVSQSSAPRAKKDDITAVVLEIL